MLLGLVFAGLCLAGWLYYLYVPKPPPAPKDLTKVFPQKLLDKATAAQLAVFRGEATSAPSETAVTADAPATAPVATDVAAFPGLKLTLTGQTRTSLKAAATNTTAAPLTWSYPAGTLFSNGSGDVVLLKDFSVHVAANATVQAQLPIAATSSDDVALTGSFTRREGVIPELAPLLKVIAKQTSVSPGAIQTAVLALTEDVPFDDVSALPRNLRPPSLMDSDPEPDRVSTEDIIAALSLLRQAGLDTRKLAITLDPELKLISMLDPRSHAAAKAFFGISDQAEWGYWRHQLLAGDPALRHYALYGIARYYPEVALTMMPHWVRTDNLARSYRISAAWALALIDDPRARRELSGLRQELADDAGMRQALDRALRHWNAAGSAKTAKVG
jgi:hypothetical protein